MTERNLSAIAEKVRKMLRMGQANSGASDTEAAFAMEAAAALMLKHGIQVSLDDDATDIKAIKGEPLWQYDETWHRGCGVAAGYLYSCRVLFYGSRGISFVGRPDNIDACQQTMQYLVAEVERLYKVNLPKGLSKEDRAEYRRTFKYSCGRRLAARAWAILETLRNDDAKAIAATGSRALVIVQSVDAQLADIDAMLKAEGVKTITVKAKKLGRGTFDGQKAGNTVQLQKQVQ